MTEPTTEQMTKDVFKGLHPKRCWHEPLPRELWLIKNDKAQCGKCFTWLKIKWIEEGFYFTEIPEYVSPAGRVLLLKEMMEHDGFGDYLSKLSRINFNQCLGAVIPVGYIIDDTGKLLKAVWEWTRRAQC